MKTASALIIGDEILTGKTKDENSFELANFLFDCGVKFRQIVTISDDIKEIADAVRSLSSANDFVFTSGGIGPTHDDKTYEAVAEAFGLELKYHGPTLEKFERFHQKYAPDRPFGKARKKMALFPSQSNVIDIEGRALSLVIVKNVYILPGIPSLFKSLFSVLKPRFQSEPLSRVLLYTQKYEGDIALSLEEVQNKYPDVAIGSYPKSLSEYKVMVSFEGRNLEIVERAASEVSQLIDGFALENASLPG